MEQNECMSLARPGCLSRAPNSAKEAESAENGQGAGFALDAFDAAVSCAGVKEGIKAYRLTALISRSVGVRSTFYSSISFSSSLMSTSVSFLLEAHLISGRTLPPTHVCVPDMSILSTRVWVQHGNL